MWLSAPTSEPKWSKTRWRRPSAVPSSISCSIRALAARVASSIWARRAASSRKPAPFSPTAISVSARAVSRRELSYCRMLILPPRLKPISVLRQPAPSVLPTPNSCVSLQGHGMPCPVFRFTEGEICNLDILTYVAMKEIEFNKGKLAVREGGQLRLLSESAEAETPAQPGTSDEAERCY